MAPLLFVALAFAAKGSVDASAGLWACAVALLFTAAFVLPANDHNPALTPLGGVVLGYAGWLLFTNFWTNAYTSAASYDAAFLLAGFVIGWRGGRNTLELLLGVALAFVVVLAVWSVWQRAVGIAPRGHAVFETPATLAAITNVILASGLVLVAGGKRNPWLIAGLTLLAAALVGTASRGGWVALTGSLVAASLLLRRAQISLDRRSMTLVAAILASGYALSLLAPLGWDTAFGTAAASGAARLELYAAAINAISESPLLTGSGYLDFRYVVDAARPSIPSYHNATTYFVHNDYLQSLLELGIPGFVFLVLLATLPGVMAWKNLPRAAADSRLVIVALAAAMTSMAVHGLVDFPFYIALCLVLYGVCAGLFSAIQPAAGSAAQYPKFAYTREMVRAAIFAGLLWILIKPVLAEAAVEYAARQSSLGNAQSAAYWFEVARRIERRDWRFHWYAGQFWFAQARAGAGAPAARRADIAFQDGSAADPRDVTNLLSRIGLHIFLRGALTTPADAATLRQWMDRASMLAPMNPDVVFYRGVVSRFESQETAK